MDKSDINLFNQVNDTEVHKMLNDESINSNPIVTREKPVNSEYVETTNFKTNDQFDLDSDKDDDQKTLEISMRAGTFTEFGSDIQSNLSKAEVLNFSIPKASNESDDDDVYPLSIKYDNRKQLKINLFKYISLTLILIFWI